jgi:hypothetical protein
VITPSWASTLLKDEIAVHDVDDDRQSITRRGLEEGTQPPRFSRRCLLGALPPALPAFE